MCVGVPGRVVRLSEEDRERAEVDVQGMRREISLVMLGDTEVERGDWVDVYMGLALEVISEEEAQEALDLLRALGPAQNGGGGPSLEDFFGGPGPWSVSDGA